MKNTTDSAFIIMALMFILSYQVADKYPLASILFTATGCIWCVVALVRSFTGGPPLADPTYHDADDGMSVAQFKRIVAGWSETDDLGAPTEVWLETGPGTTSPCVRVRPLNRREHDNGQVSADLLLEPDPRTWVNKPTPNNNHETA